MLFHLKPHCVAGDVLISFYIDLSPRWYRVIKQTAFQVLAVRLKERYVEGDGFCLKTLPGSSVYDFAQTEWFKKRGKHLSHKGFHAYIYTPEMEEALLRPHSNALADASEWAVIMGCLNLPAGPTEETKARKL